MRPWVLLACCFSLVVPALGEGPFDDIYFFGDSLTDTGNLAALEPALGPPPAFPPGRYCNGRMWPEYLSSMLLGDDHYGGPFLYGVAPQQGNNFAMIGASAYDNPGYIDLPHQIDSVIAHQGGTLSPDSLYVFSFPTADFAYYYQTVGPHELNAGVALFFTWRSAGSVYQAIKRLHTAGARRFLVFNAPIAGTTPAMRTRGLESFGLLLSTMSNVFLQGALSAFPNELSGDLYLLDFFALTNFFYLDSVLLGGYFFGLRDFVNPCILQLNGQAVPNPDCSRSTFVDWVHLSSRAHYWVATAAVDLLAKPPRSSVPTP